MYPNLVLWFIVMSWSVVQKDWYAIFKIMAQQWLIWWKYDSLYYVFWTVDPFPAKVCLVVDYYKPCEEIGLLCIGPLYSRSRSQWRVKMSMFIQMISAKPPNILLPNMLLWCIIMNWNVMQKDLFTIFKVKVTTRAHMIKIW